MTKALFLSAFAACLLAAPASAQFCSEQSISWTEGGERHVTVIEGRIRNGCPVVRQSITRADGDVTEETGVDCDCDLLIDGAEERFSKPLAIVSGRMLSVCEANRASYQPVFSEAAG